MVFGIMNQFVYFYVEVEDGSWWGDNVGFGVYVIDD